MRTAPALFASLVSLAGCSTPSSMPDARDAIADGADESSLGDASMDQGPPDVIDVSDITVDAGPPRILLQLDRESGATTTRIDVTVTVLDGADRGIAGLAVRIDAPAADVSAVREDGAGDYFATLSPHDPSGEVTVTATAMVAATPLSLSRVALVLPYIDDAWNQAEVVGGLVNTPGFEGDANVSSDGHWLFVSHYSPVDSYCCVNGCRTPAFDSAYCQRSQGPYVAPARPGFFGAGRIVDDAHIRNQCPSLCEVAPGGGDVTGFLPPPSAGYLFRREPDGTFDDPHVFGFDADGCADLTAAAPVEASTGSPAWALFAYAHDTMPRALFVAPLVLGADNVWGRYACESGAPVLQGSTATPLSLAASDVSDPFFDGMQLWFTSSASTAPRISFASAMGSLPGASFAPPESAPIGMPGDALRHPILDVDTSYFERNGAIDVATVTGDPSVAASWSAPVHVLAAEPGDFATGRVGAIVVLASPSLADAPDGGPDELYFTYGRVTATGADFNVARITHR